MSRTRLKYYIGIIAVFVIGGLHVLFFDNNSKYDVYLLYNHKRYLTNILYDISVLFDFSVLTYFLIRLDKVVFKPLFIISLLTWISYFVNYNQLGSLLLIPAYLVLARRHYKKTLK